ncbi:hypothetical protein VTJ49DRAFT_4373 [Mycothermus thermophilus]|uniref:Peroxin 26 n=1 Tax=Humicola insolens TaxID=85995 RepID=A0ABR3VLS5_HUMIN
MATNRTLYTAADSIAQSRGLPGPMASLSSTSGRNPASSHISKTYRQASTLFLTRRLPEALSTVLPLVTPTPPAEGTSESTEPAPVVRASRSSRIKVWSLYLTVLNAIVELGSDEGKDAFGAQEWKAICHKVREGEVWEEVVRNGYHGVEGDVDAEVVINLATLLLAHAKTQTLNQKRLENYLAASRTPNLDSIPSDRFSESPRRYRSPRRGAPSGADTPRDLNARVKLLELYTLHVLPRNGEWEYAREFISVSPVLDDERRDAFLQALDTLREETEAAERREEEERRKREEAIRRDIEEARRLRAENEARERKRIEEERARREAAEAQAKASASVADFGVDGSTTPPRRRGTPAAAGSRSPASSRGLARSKGPVARRAGSGNTVATPTLMSRATTVLRNLRVLVDEVASAFRTNPRKKIRERMARAIGVAWAKVKATAGMGTKVSYI